jgi:ATP/maltotriose-dependent transcriptional regulator MalT
MTQDGIASALSISRAHVALELKRLRTSGRIEERMAHVANARSRRKVYDLAPAGQEVARRMREHAKARTVALVEGASRREASGLVAIEALRHAGLRESEAVQRILASDVVVLPTPEPPGPRAPSGRPFFGRDREIARLKEWLSADGAAFAIVIGVAGIGKTALVGKVLEGEARPVLVRRLYPHDDAHGILSSLADFLVRQGRRRLRAVLVRPAYDPTEAAAILREDLRGCVLAFDDLHACPAADGLLRGLLDPPPEAKVVVATRAQPAFYGPTDLDRRAVVEMRIDGLDEDAAVRLLEGRGASLPPGDASRVIRATGGHPLTLELFASSGLEAGLVASDRYVLETVLDGVDGPSEDLLKTFAILRRPARSPEALGGSLTQLRRLVRQAILHHREDGYFVHDLVRDFFVRRMEDAERRRAHARAAGYWAGRSDALEEAYHRIESGDPDRAAFLLAEAGPALAESARAGDLEACLLRLPRDRRPDALLAEAQMFLGKFEEARHVLSDLADRGPPEDRLRARIQLGRIANRLGSYGEARSILTQAVRDADVLRRADVKAEALRALGAAERKLGDLSSALDHLREAAALLEYGSRERVRALTDLGAALIARGDLATAKGYLVEAASAVRPGSREEAAIQINLGIVLSRGGEAREAAETFRRSADIALATGDVRFASYALANAVDNFLQLEETDAAAASAERALDLARTIGDPLAVSTARANLGLVFARRGEWARAEEHLLGSVELIARLENPYSLATRYDEIARLYESQGRTGDAASWRTRAADLFARLQGDGGSATKG